MFKIPWWSKNISARSVTSQENHSDPLENERNVYFHMTNLDDMVNPSKSKKVIHYKQRTKQ
jgi:hypothetical protein